MSREILTPENTNAILNMADQLRKANIFEDSTQKPFGVQSITFDLATAAPSGNPFRIGFPFKSAYVVAATDVLANIVLIPTTNDSYQSGIPMKQNDAWEIEQPVAQAFVTWTAQPGKTLTVLFFVDSAFRSGSQISVTGGGVSIVDGSTVTGPTRAVLSAATAGIIAPALSTRKKATLQNKTGADIYLGDSTVTNSGATEGILVPNGGIIYWQNTGALYGYSVAGGNVHRLEET